MPTLLPPPDQADAAVDAALAEMEERSERRNRLASHLELCPECDDVLCQAGAELMRVALA